MQVATLVIDKGEGVNYTISTINIGTTTREQKIYEFQGSVATIMQQMNTDQSSKEELKVRVVNLSAYIQQWKSLEEEAPSTSSTPLLLSQEELSKMEKMKNWTKATVDQFQWVLYDGDMGIGHASQMTNKFWDVQKQLEAMEKICHQLTKLYKITHPQLDAILKMPERTWEKELALVKDDHWLVETWKMGLDHRRDVLERVLHKMNNEDYLKLMTDFDMPIVELDLEKIRPHLHKKIQQGATDSLTSGFMDFAARAFIQSEQVIKAFILDLQMIS